VKPELESLFHIDRSDPSTGIKISLKKTPEPGETEKRGNGEIEMTLPDSSRSPIHRFRQSPTPPMA
jgi:hypothetical protein